MEHDIYIAALQYYGDQTQKIKTIEECGELVQALAKNYNENGYLFDDHVIEELADVQIMINQMIILFGQLKFQQVMQLKLHRLIKKITIRDDLN